MNKVSFSTHLANACLSKNHIREKTFHNRSYHIPKRYTVQNKSHLASETFLLLGLANLPYPKIIRQMSSSARQPLQDTLMYIYNKNKKVISQEVYRLRVWYVLSECFRMLFYFQYAILSTIDTQRVLMIFPLTLKYMHYYASDWKPPQSTISSTY